MEQRVEIKTTPNYYEHVFQNAIKSDFKIVIKDKVIKVHKQVLGQQNLIFLDLFMSQPDVGKIEISDLDSNAVETFVDYLYTGKVSVGNISEDLFQVAHTYLDPNLKNVCRQKLRQNLREENVVRRFLVFVQCEDKVMIKETSMFLVKNYNNVKILSDFKKVLLKPEAVAAICDAFDDCKVTVLTEEKSPSRESLIESANSSDLVVKVHDNNFLAHKKVLSSRNAVLETAITAFPPFSNGSSQISIIDFSPETFKIFLTYIYTREVCKTDISTELIVVAHKYVDYELKKICEDHFVSKICEANAVELLILAGDVESPTMEEKVSKFIADRFADMKKRADYQKLKQNPKAVHAVFSRFEDKLMNTSINVIDQKSNDYVCEFIIDVPPNEGEVYSGDFYMKSVPWDICVQKKSKNSTHVGLFLRCKDSAFMYSHKLTFTLKIVSSIDKKFDVSFTIVDRYFSVLSGVSSGWNNFMSYDDYYDATKGLMKSFNKILVRLDAKFVK